MRVEWYLLFYGIEALINEHACSSHGLVSVSITQKRRSYENLKKMITKGRVLLYFLAYSHDVMAAILVYQTSPMGVKLLNLM